MAKDCISVLIVEDDSDDLFICQEALKGTQYRYCLAQAMNGRQLVEMMLGKGEFQNLEKPNPDFVILDINMPIMDGLEALSVLKEKGALADIPVYILTTSINPAHKEKAQKLGAKRFFSKPSNMKGFQDIFQEIIQAL